MGHAPVSRPVPASILGEGAKPCKVEARGECGSGAFDRERHEPAGGLSHHAPRGAAGGGRRPPPPPPATRVSPPLFSAACQLPFGGVGGSGARTESAGASTASSVVPALSSWPSSSS